MATQTSLSKDDILGAIGNMSVFELAELIEAFKEKFNVTIAAPAAAPAAGGGGGGGGAGGAGGRGRGGRRGGAGGRGEDRVYGRLEERRREEDPGDQRDPGDHQPGPEGGQGPGGGRARHREGRRVQAGSRRDQEEARSAGRGCRTEVRHGGADAAGHGGPPATLGSSLVDDMRGFATLLLASTSPSVDPGPASGPGLGAFRICLRF